MQAMRDAVLQKQADALAAWRAEVDATPADAPLWQWTRLLGRGFYDEDAVIDKIRKLDRRQSDAEAMLKRGDFPLADLNRFDLDPTPAVCLGAKAELQAQVAPLAAAKPQARPYSDVSDKVDAALAAMSWLVGYGCAVDAESQAWQTMAEGYRDPGWTIHELADLRDPKALGRTLRDSPEKFSQLGPQARLWAWLSFADRPETHDAAIAGARQVAGRTDDAVQMLEDKNWGPGIFVLIAAIPSLDLDATPRLCAAALAHLREDRSRQGLSPERRRSAPIQRIARTARRRRAADRAAMARRPRLRRRGGARRSGAGRARLSGFAGAAGDARQSRGAASPLNLGGDQPT